jgi:tRNA-Thr(GGU) m(6)t(6)A37 methyltransferase TsaA
VETLTLHPIGVIRTPFRDRADAPRQPRARRDPSEGIVVLRPGLNFEQALEDLDGFEFIWIVSWFHKNANWKTKVLPPRGSTVKRGVFATRSPYRPNPIGLSLARLISVKGRSVRVAETDLIDGTPILDLKPYLPYAEAFPEAGAGWLESLRHDCESHYAVEWSDVARAQSAWLIEHFEINLCAHGERVLSRNIEPHPYRRISKNASGCMEVAIKSWRLEFAPTKKGVEIQRVASGYSAAALNARSADEPLHDEAAHIAFHAQWRQGV